MKIRAFLLLVFLLLGSILLFSCNENGTGGEGLEDFESMLEDMTSDATEPQEAPFAKKVYVVVGENCSGQLASKADELSASIKEKTGVDTVVKYDNEELEAYYDDLVIYLGNTNSLISEEAIKPLRYGDYICKWDHGSIFIGGRHDEATVSAIDEFIGRVLHSAAYTSLMGPDTYIERINDYEIDKITLNGYDLYDFKLVYGEADAAREAAELMRELIVRRSGYLVDTLPSSALDDTVGKTITITVDGEGAKCGIACDGFDVCVYGGNEYALSVAVADLADILLGRVTDGVSAAVINGTAERSCENRVLNVCEARFELNSAYDIDYSIDIIRAVKDAQYDVIVFKDLDEEETETVNVCLINLGYSVKKCGDRYTVLYKSAVLEDVSCTSDALGDAMTVKMRAVGETRERKFVCAVSENSLNIADDGVCGVVISDGGVSAEGMSCVSGSALSVGEIELFREVLADDCLCVLTPHARIVQGNGYEATFYSVGFNRMLSHGYLELKESVK